jgi:hypothetical protein
VRSFDAMVSGEQETTSHNERKIGRWQEAKGA